MASLYVRVVLVVLLVFCGPTTSAQQSASGDAFRLSTFYVDEGFGANRRALEEFRALVEGKLGDKLRIDVREIPPDPKAVLELVGSGKALAAPSFALISQRVAPSFDVFQLPYLFPDVQAVHGALDSEPGARLRADALKKGFVTLGFFDGGFGWVYSKGKNPLRSSADFKGLRFIVPQDNPITRDIVSSFGGSANARPLSEIPKAIAAGRDDAAVLTYAQGMYLGEVRGGALTLSNHAFTGYALLVGTPLWDKLSDRDRTLLTRAGREASRIQREHLQRQTGYAIAKMSGAYARYNPSDTEKRALRQASTPTHLAFTAKVGKDVIELFEAALEKRPVGSALVSVWYGTNRNPVSGAAARVQYGNDRTNELRFGKATVLVPQGQEFAYDGIYEGFVRWIIRIKVGDARLRVVEVQEKSGVEALDDLKAELKRSARRNKALLVYIHGFKNSFEDALMRAAQISYDIKFPGMTVAFSWPSKQDITTYPDDEATIEHAEDVLEEFLIKLQQYGDGAELHILAHSMGNRALMRVINSAAVGKSRAFGQVILAAPDVDLGKFESMARSLPNIAKRTTIYVSAKDKALATSKWLHGYARAGYTPPISVFPGLDTIDASNVDIDGIGHGYIAEAASVLYDLAALIRYNESPEDRLRLRKEVNEKRQVFWRFN